MTCKYVQAHLVTDKRNDDIRTRLALKLLHPGLRLL